MVRSADDGPLLANYLSSDHDCDNDGSANDVDVDDDNDRLIEINFLEDLDKIRNDLNGNGDGSGAIGTMGAPEGGLRGYELSRALDFVNAASYRGAAGTGAGQIDATDGVRATWCPAGLQRWYYLYSGGPHHGDVTRWLSAHRR